MTPERLAKIRAYNEEPRVPVRARVHIADLLGAYGAQAKELIATQRALEAIGDQFREADRLNAEAIEAQARELKGAYELLHETEDRLADAWVAIAEAREMYASQAKQLDSMRGRLQRHGRAVAKALEALEWVTDYSNDPGVIRGVRKALAAIGEEKS